MQQISEWEKDLSGVIARGKDIKIDYQKYSKCYPFTNEKLKDLTELIDKTKVNNALCVLSSGDHVFNLVYHGITNIDTFDCNKITEYYALGFKKMAIQCLNYQQFINFFTQNTDERIAMENYVISCLPEKYQSFWQNYIKYLADNNDSYYGLFDSLLSSKGVNRGVFGLLGFVDDGIKTNNNYLASENDYQKLQKNLVNAKINFQKKSIKDIHCQKQKYDLIMLSNVLQAMRKPLFGKAINIAQKIYKHNLNDEGEMIYLYEFFDPEFLGQKGMVLERSPKGQDIRYILDGSYAVGKKKI